jgi:hypothetical protein
MKLLLRVTALTFVLTSTSLFAGRQTSLSLFGVALAHSTRSDVNKAVIAAGGRLLEHKGNQDLYDAHALALPEALRLRIVYLDNRFVLAQYEFSQNGEKDELLRRMLAEKYGVPEQHSGFAMTGQFDGEYVTDGKYTWRFSDNVTLTYDHEFFGERFLSYVDRDSEAELEARLEAAAAREADKVSHNLSDKF